MAKKKDALNRMLKLLNKKSMSQGEISKTLKIGRVTEWRIIKEACDRRWVLQDHLGRYHLTSLGKINIDTAENPTDSSSFQVQSQIIDFLNLRPDRPTATCTIEIENADKIKELDSRTDATKRFLTKDGLWLPENNTNLKAAMAAVVDSIFDLKAKEMGLFSMLDEEFRINKLAPTLFNMRNYFPGHDALKRYENLAKTKFSALIEFDGEKWVSKQDFEDLEKKIQKERESWSHFGHKMMEERVRFNKAIYNLLSGGSDLSTVYLNTMHLFHNHKELREYLINHFKINQITDKDQLDTIVKNGFDTNFFSIEKMTLYRLNVGKDKELQFFRSLPFLSSISLSERQQDKRDIFNQEFTNINTDNIISTISKELEYFEKAYIHLLVKVIEKFDNAHSNQLYATTKDAKEKYTAQLLPIKKALDELLDIFYEIMIAYVIRSIIAWPKKIENRNILNKAYSILFSKIANIRILFAQGFEDSYSKILLEKFENIAMSRMYMTQSLLNHKDIFKNANMEKESEELMDSIWNIQKECIQHAFPEPLIYGWEFDYKNDDWKKLIQVQMQNPEQTYDKFIENLLKTN
jgi:hypothetical protein